MPRSGRYSPQLLLFMGAITGQRDAGANGCAILVGLDVEPPIQLPNPFAHGAKSNTSRFTDCGESIQQVGWHPFAIIPYFELGAIIVKRRLNVYRLAVSVSQDIRQTLLQRTE